MKLVDKSIQQKPSGPIYHYTSAAGLIGILEKKSLWASSHLHMNDVSELEIAATVFKKEVANSSLSVNQQKLLDAFLRKMQKTQFLVSLSLNNDLLSQWRAYCPGGEGYALGFSPGNPIFEAAEAKSFHLIKCEYAEAEQKELCKILISEFLDRWEANAFANRNDTGIDDGIRNFFANYSFAYALQLVTASFKHDGFREEGEWRLVSQYPDRLPTLYRPGRFGIVPYQPLPLAPDNTAPRIDSITIGPSANKPVAEEALNQILKTNKFRDTKIVISETPLRQ